MPMDEALLVAHAELVGRAGASDLTIGFSEAEPATWWATATLTAFVEQDSHEVLVTDGVQLVAVEGQKGPIEALRALAVKLIESGMCAHCGSTVTTDKDIAEWNPEKCHWRIVNNAWVRGCEG